MTASKYQTLSIEQLDALMARLAAAMANPRCSNRAQVSDWYMAAWDAYCTAQGWR